MKTKDLLIGATLLAIVAAVGLLWISPDGLNQAPSATLKTLDGRDLNLDELRGRPILVTFWATTCPGCLEEMPHLVELYEEYSQRGLEIIGIAMAYDPPSQVNNLVRARGVPYTIALDLDSSAAMAFGNVRLTPTSFLIAPDGRIVQHKIGELDLAIVKQQLDGWLS